MGLRPLNDRIVVRRKEETKKTAGGIVLPDSSKEKPSQGEVVAVGTGQVLPNGDVKPVGVQVGNTVVFGKGSGNTVEVDGEEFLVMTESEIYAVVE